MPGYDSNFYEVSREVWLWVQEALVWFVSTRTVPRAPTYSRGAAAGR